MFNCVCQSVSQLFHVEIIVRMIAVKNELQNAKLLIVLHIYCPFKMSLKLNVSIFVAFGLNLFFFVLFFLWMFCLYFNVHIGHAVLCIPAMIVNKTGKEIEKSMLQTKSNRPKPEYVCIYISSAIIHIYCAIVLLRVLRFEWQQLIMMNWMELVHI